MLTATLHLETFMRSAKASSKVHDDGESMAMSMTNDEWGL